MSGSYKRDRKSYVVHRKLQPAEAAYENERKLFKGSSKKQGYRLPYYPKALK
jgi:hypothetical protein